MRYFLIFFLSFFITNSILAQLDPVDIQIPMRDDQNLAAHLYLPNETDSFPVILIQTPYNKNFYQFTGLPLEVGFDLENSPYAFVILDWRCFFGSIGACSVNINRGEDGYDAVEWIADQPWSNGKIGTLGPSALGNIQYQTAREQPPHLVCAMPEVSSPQTRYDIYYPGGAFRVEYVETLGILFGINNLILNNPYYNLLWQIVEDGSIYPEDITIPMFLLGGWYDHNTTDVLLMLDTLRNASDPGIQDLHKLVMGPWVHGGTGQASVGTAQQGELSYPDAAGWNATLGLRFFDYYLRNMDNGWDTLSPYLFYQMGANLWDSSTEWPPANVAYATWYLHPDNTIQPTAPGSTSGALSFMYDPADPSPTVGGKTLNLALDQGPYDQGPEVESRNDNLLFTSPILQEDLIIQGPIKVNLQVSSDQIDTDFALRLTEVYPDGRSMLLGETIQRMRFRNGYTASDTALIDPGTIYQISFTFDDLAVTIKPGHRLRLIVSSSNYPRFNRNMNTGGQMYPNSNPDTLVNPLVAQNTIHCNQNQISSIEIPLGPVLTSIESQEITSAMFSLFPSPSRGTITVQSDHELRDLWILSAQGQVLIHQQPACSSCSVNLRSLPNGLYLAKIMDQSGKSQTKKFTLISN